MDPNAARSKMIDKANQVLGLLNVEPSQAHPDPDREIAAVAVDLAEAVHDLDEWLRAGGFLPDVWALQKGYPATVAQHGRKQDIDIGVREVVPTLVDDERPAVDGTMCEYTMRDQDGLYDGACTLDRGHDGPHA